LLGSKPRSDRELRSTHPSRKERG